MRVYVWHGHGWKAIALAASVQQARYLVLEAMEDRNETLDFIPDEIMAAARAHILGVLPAQWANRNADFILTV